MLRLQAFCVKLASLCEWCRWKESLCCPYLLLPRRGLTPASLSPLEWQAGSPTLRTLVGTHPTLSAAPAYGHSFFFVQSHLISQVQVLCRPAGLSPLRLHVCSLFELCLLYSSCQSGSSLGSPPTAAISCLQASVNMIPLHLARSWLQHAAARCTGHDFDCC